MPTIATSLIIAQPVEKVFAYVTAVENHTAWQAGIQSARLVPAGPVAVGSTYVYTTEVMGQRIESQLQVTGLEPNRSWVVTTVGVPNAVQTAYRFEPASGGTQLTLSMDVPAGAYPAAVEAMVTGQMRKSLDEQAARIKTLLHG